MKMRKSRSGHIAGFRELGMVGAILLLCALVQSRNASFFSLENFDDILTNTAILGILAVGMMPVMISRGIDLSLGSTLALSGMVVTKLMISYPELPVILAVLLGILIGMACGAVVGSLIAWGGVPPIIASMGMMNAFRGITYVISDGKWVSAHQMTPEFTAIATGRVMGINNLVIIAVGVFAAAYIFLQHINTGRKIYAIGSNPGAAEISGIHTKKILCLIYVIMGGLSGLCGILWVSKYASAQGNTAAGYEMSVIAACVLGGVSVDGGAGKIGGLILGVLFYGILSNSLPMLNVSSFWQQSIQAVIILAAVILNVLIKRRMDSANQKRRKI